MQKIFEYFEDNHYICNYDAKPKEHHAQQNNRQL